MKSVPFHQAVVFATPWPGIHGTRLDSARRFGRHWHSTHGIGIVERGAQRSASGCGEVDAFEGDVIATNPGEVHDGQPLGTPARRWRMLYFEPGVLQGALQFALHGDSQGDSRGDPLIRPVLRDPRLRAALEALFDAIDGWQRLPPGPAAQALRLHCDETLAGCLARLDGAPAARLPPPSMERVRQRLSDDAAAAPPLAELAVLAGCSRFQVLRQFSSAYGMPPHAWLLARRAEAARRAITAGASLAEAAAASGFADQSHMTRVFVRHHGYTPGAWAAALQ